MNATHDDATANSAAGWPLRRATDADAQAITALVEAAYGQYVERIGRLPLPMTADHAAAIRDHEVWVVERHDEVVGVLELIPGPDHLFVVNVAVRPDLKGRGLGRRLLDHAEAEARRRRMVEVRLDTNERFVENLAIYRRRGYVEVGRTAYLGTDVVHLVLALPATLSPAADSAAPP